MNEEVFGISRDEMIQNGISLYMYDFEKQSGQQ